MPARLKAARLDKGLSLRAAAERIGVSRETLARAERGDRPHPKTAKRIADFYDLKPTAIWPVEGDDRWDGTGRREAVAS